MPAGLCFPLFHFFLFKIFFLLFEISIFELQTSQSYKNKNLTKISICVAMYLNKEVYNVEIV